jgi:hypothetical protein
VRAIRRSKSPTEAYDGPQGSGYPPGWTPGPPLAPVPPMPAPVVVPVVPQPLPAPAPNGSTAPPIPAEPPLPAPTAELPLEAERPPAHLSTPAELAGWAASRLPAA